MTKSTFLYLNSFIQNRSIYNQVCNMSIYPLRDSVETPTEYPRGRQVFRNCLLRAGSDKYLGSNTGQVNPMGQTLRLTSWMCLESPEKTWRPRLSLRKKSFSVDTTEMIQDQHSRRTKQFHHNKFLVAKATREDSDHSHWESLTVASKIIKDY